MAEGPNGIGSSRHRLIGACEASLRRLSFSFPSSTRGELADALERADRGGLSAALDLRAALRRRLDLAADPGQNL